MANIKGITIKIDGETSNLTKSLKDVNKVVFSTNSELKQLNQALKLNPKSTELLAQKQDVLRKNIAATKERLDTLKEAQKQMGNYSSLTEEQKEKYRALSVEITKSESSLQKMNGELENTKKGNLDSVNQNIEKVGKTSIKVGDIIKANLASEAIVRVFDSIVNKIKSLASSITGVFKSVGKMAISGGIDRALNLENARAKLSTFTKSTEQLDEIMKNVGDSVDGTAFSMDSAATVAAGLFAAGIKEGDEMTRSLKLVADTAQVSGRSMDDIGAIFNKVAANGKLTGEELNQLADSGIPVLQMLADSTGKSTEEVRTLVSAGQIGFAEFSAAMEKGLGGAAQKAGMTFTSSLQNLKSAMSRVGAEIMTPLLEGITPVMNSAKDMLKKALSGEDITADMQNMVTQLQAFFTTVAENGSTVLSGLLTNIGNAVVQLLPTVIEGLISTIQTLLPQIVQMIMSMLPQILSAITQLISGIASMISGNQQAIANTMKQLISMIVNFITTNLPTIIELGINLLLALAQGIAESIPQIIPKLIECIMTLVDTFTNNIDQWIETGIQIILALIEGLVEAIPQIVEKIPEIIMKLVQTIIENLPLIIEAAIQIIMALATGLIQAIPQLVTTIPQIIIAIIQALIQSIPKFIENGGKMIAGIITGIGNNLGKLASKAGEIKNKIIDKIKNLPKDLLKWGGDMMKGLADGIKKGIGKVGDAVKGIAKKIKNLLHFSRPDEGPLREYEKWMPDFMRGLASGIKKSSFLVESATSDLARKMSNKLSLDSLLTQASEGMKDLNFGINNSTNPLINPNATALNNQLLIDEIKDIVDTDTKESSGNFQAIINNNSKYTSPSENVRLLRQVYERYKLKYGGKL